MHVFDGWIGSAPQAVGLARAIPWAACLIALLGACSDPLEVVDPDVVLPENLTGAQGADLYYGGGIADFASAFAAREGGVVIYVGLFTDEFHLTGAFPSRYEVDRRSVSRENDPLGEVFAGLHRARYSTGVAVAALQGHDPSDRRVAEMRNLNAYAHVFVAENYCSGVPLSSVGENGELMPGQPLTTVEWLTTAVERFDDAFARAGDDNQRYLARVGKARALLGLNDYQAAANAVTDVPTSWIYAVRMSDNTWYQRNAVFIMTLAGRWSVSHREGGNGVDFREPDLRVPWERTSNAFDGSGLQYDQLKYPTGSSSVILASGTEARLIEAEAALADGDVVTWLGKHSEVRGLVGLDPLQDPGSQDARVDLHFTERARWLYAEGHRLADLRRLLRQYGRAADSVFPSGEYRKGGRYGTDVNWIVPQEEQNNPLFTGCLNRDA